MDRISDSDSEDAGSIPAGATKLSSHDGGQFFFLSEFHLFSSLLSKQFFSFLKSCFHLVAEIMIDVALKRIREAWFY
jgi:hypothetical protein